ncbi:MAG: MerR family transcriptional regulator [Acidobacteria bacterium]|nr:MerR family transcriptional regulator [Acidobacteriota bacterium]
MKGRVLILDEFIAQTGVPRETLREWERLRLLRPVGFTEEQVPFYNDRSVQEAEHIRKLTELGYHLEDVEKILKKIGLPQGSEGASERREPENYLTVGALADKVGVSPRTIKHWEDKGIIVPDMRSEGGFRLYSGAYIYLCKLIKDLQLFSFTLEEIKTVSDYFQDFLELQENLAAVPKEDAARRLDAMLEAIENFFNKMNQFKEGIQRWENLLKKKRKEIQGLKTRNRKRPELQAGEQHAANGIH